MQVQRQGVESHLESAARVHLDLACVKLNNTEVELNKAKDKLKKIEDKLDNTLALLNEKKVAGAKHENMFLWRIDMFQRDFERSQKRRKRENRQ